MNGATRTLWNIRRGLVGGLVCFLVTFVVLTLLTTSYRFLDWYLAEELTADRVQRFNWFRFLVALLYGGYVGGCIGVATYLPAGTYRLARTFIVLVPGTLLIALLASSAMETLGLSEPRSQVKTIAPPPLRVEDVLLTIASPLVMSGIVIAARVSRLNRQTTDSKQEPN